MNRWEWFRYKRRGDKILAAYKRTVWAFTGGEASLEELQQARAALRDWSTA